MRTPTSQARRPSDEDVNIAINALVAGDPRVTVIKNLSDLSRAGQLRLAAVWPELSESVRRRTVRQMGRLAENRVELKFDRAFEIALGDASADIRRAAIAGLWENETREHLDLMSNLAESDTDLQVRVEAIRALGRFATLASLGQVDADAAAELRDRLHWLATGGASGSVVPAAAIAAAGPFGGEAVKELVHTALETDDPGLRLAAIIAMGRSMEGRWLEPLTRLLEDGDPDERSAAAEAIGEIGDARAVADLADAARDPTPAVRQAAVAALGGIGGVAAAKVLRQLEEIADDDERAMIASAMSNAQGDMLPF